MTVVGSEVGKMECRYLNSREFLYKRILIFIRHLKNNFDRLFLAGGAGWATDSLENHRSFYFAT